MFLIKPYVNSCRVVFLAILLCMCFYASANNCQDAFSEFKKASGKAAQKSIKNSIKNSIKIRNISWSRMYGETYLQAEQKNKETIGKETYKVVQEIEATHQNLHQRIIQENINLLIDPSWPAYSKRKADAYKGIEGFLKFYKEYKTNRRLIVRPEIIFNRLNKAQKEKLGWDALTQEHLERVVAQNIIGETLGIIPFSETRWNQIRIKRLARYFAAYSFVDTPVKKYLFILGFYLRGYGFGFRHKKYISLAWPQFSKFKEAYEDIIAGSITKGYYNTDEFLLDRFEFNKHRAREAEYSRLIEPDVLFQINKNNKSRRFADFIQSRIDTFITDQNDINNLGSYKGSVGYLRLRTAYNKGSSPIHPLILLRNLSQEQIKIMGWHHVKWWTPTNSSFTLENPYDKRMMTLNNSGDIQPERVQAVFSSLAANVSHFKGVEGLLYLTDLFVKGYFEIHPSRLLENLSETQIKQMGWEDANPITIMQYIRTYLIGIKPPANS